MLPGDDKIKETYSNQCVKLLAKNLEIFDLQH